MAEGGSSYRSGRPAGILDSDSDTCSSSDDEAEIWKRKRKRVCGVEEMDTKVEFQNPLRSAASGGGFRKNNIWGDVVSEQTVAQDLLSFGVETKADIAHTVSRDVESYKVNREMMLELQKKQEEAGSGMEDEPQTHDSPEHGGGDKKADDIFDSENASKSVKDRLGYSASSRSQYRDMDDIGSDDDTQPSRSGHRRRDWRERETRAKSEDFSSLLQQYQKEREEIKIGEKRKRERTKRFATEGGKSKKEHSTAPKHPVTADDSPEQVLKFVMTGLKEDNMKLFTLIVEMVGNTKTLDLYSKTQDVEEVGGMMTLNGKRRRTPGGVFIQLLKSDKDVTKEQLDKIFAESHQHWKQVKKAGRKKKREGDNIRAAKEVKEAMMAKGMEGVYKEYLDTQLEGWMKKEKRSVPCTEKMDAEAMDLNVPSDMSVTKTVSAGAMNNNGTDKLIAGSADQEEEMMESPVVDKEDPGEGSEEGEILD